MKYLCPMIHTFVVPTQPYTTIMAESKYIEIKGARVNNLKNIDVKIPRNKLVVITGLSGSGKSSLAFDTMPKGNGVMWRACRPTPDSFWDV